MRDLMKINYKLTNVKTNLDQLINIITAVYAKQPGEAAAGHADTKVYVWDGSTAVFVTVNCLQDIGYLTLSSTSIKTIVKISNFIVSLLELLTIKYEQIEE